MKSKILTIALVITALLVSGCGSDDSSETADSNGNQADAMFVTGMIPHHEAAVDMAELGVNSAEHAEIKELSENIITSQQAEIKQMNELKSSLPESSESMMSDDDMSAMMNDVESLKGAKDFDKAFIDAMIPHHQSAVVMANQVIADGSNPEVEKLAKSIVTAQSKEINDMQTWRTEWYGAPLPADKAGSMGSMHSAH